MTKISKKQRKGKEIKKNLPLDYEVGFIRSYKSEARTLPAINGLIENTGWTIDAENGWQTHNNTDGYVINGCYYVARDKEYNIIKVFGARSGDCEHQAYYLGDVEFNGDYNKTIQEYEDTRKVIGQNLIKVEKPIENKKDSCSDEPAF